MSQPLLWAWLYGKELRVKPAIAQVGLVILAAGFWVFNVSYGNYTRELLAFYALATAYAVGRFASRPNLQPICLGFLIVYFNSFFWEAPIHLADLLEGHFGVVAVQSLHLVAVPMLLAMGLRPRAEWWRPAMYLWILVQGMSYLHLSGYVNGDRWAAAMFMLRAVSLGTLLYVLGDNPLNGLKRRFNHG